MITGKEIRERRKRIGLTQAQFAAMLETNQQAVQKWEKGKVIPLQRRDDIVQTLERLERQMLMKLQAALGEGEKAAGRVA